MHADMIASIRIRRFGNLGSGEVQRSHRLSELVGARSTNHNAGFRLNQNCQNVEVNRVSAYSIAPRGASANAKLKNGQACDFAPIVLTIRSLGTVS